MADDEALPKTVKFVYRNSDDYRDIYVNGIHGGFTSRGEISFELFLEHRHKAGTEIHNLLNEGRLGPRVEIEPEEGSPDEVIIVRERQVGVILTPEHAKSIAQWILKKVEEFEDMQEQKPQSQEENQNGSL